MYAFTLNYLTAETNVKHRIETLSLSVWVILRACETRRARGEFWCGNVHLLVAILHT